MIFKAFYVGFSTLLALPACFFVGDSTDPGLPATDEPPCDLIATAYRIDSVTLPRDNIEANEFGLNLDLDERDVPDNLLGQVFAILEENLPEETAPLHVHLDAALGSDTLPWAVEVQRCADGTEHLRVGVYRAAENADGSLNLQRGEFLPAIGDGDAAIDGLAESGSAEFPISAFVDVAGVEPAVTWVTGLGLAVDLEAETEAEISGRLGIGLPPAAVDIALPILAAYLTTLLDGDPMTDDNIDVDALFDVDASGVIEVEELRSNALIAALTAPDIDLAIGDGGAEAYAPNEDGERDHLSLGIRFHASAVTAVATQ